LAKVKTNQRTKRKKTKKQKKDKTKKQNPTEKDTNHSSEDSLNEDKPPTYVPQQPPSAAPKTLQTSKNLSTVTTTTTSEPSGNVYPTLCLFWMQQVKLEGCSKGDFVYFSWSVDEIIENSPVMKVKDPKKIKWPKLSQFSVNTTIKGNLGKSKESLQEKILLITFLKVLFELNGIGSRTSHSFNFCRWKIKKMQN